MTNTAENIESESSSTSLVIVMPTKTEAAKYFEPKGLDPIIDKIRKEVEAFQPDISTKEGRAKIASFAFKVAKSKTALDNLGKEMVASMKEQVKAVDAERARAWDIVEGLQRQARKPLTDWEDAEKKRVNDHEDMLNEITHLGHDANTPEELGVVLDGMGKYKLRDWQEFSARAISLIETKTANLFIRHSAAVKAETDRLELARLREEETKRKREAEDKRIADEAAEKERLRLVAEQKKKDDATAAAQKKKEDDAAAAQKKKDHDAELERLRLKKEKDDAEARTQKAEKDRKAAQDAAAAAAIAAVKKAKDDADAAVESERKRVAKVKSDEEAAARKREADTAHREKINNEALKAIVENVTDMAFLITPHMAQAIVAAIANGKITHVKITY